MSIRLACALITCLLLPIRVDAQEPDKPAAEKQVASTPPLRNLIIPLKLNVIVSKYQGDKKISSLPYLISVNSNNNRMSTRMLADVPYATGGATTDGKPAPAYAFRTIGLSIDAAAGAYEGGLYRLEITVADSSIASNNQLQGAPANVPIFRNFSVNSSVMLKDGQTTQLTSAADPITGEIMRVDVTLTVPK